jgi:hypothetical protein
MAWPIFLACSRHLFVFVELESLDMNDPSILQILEFGARVSLPCQFATDLFVRRGAPARARPFGVGLEEGVYMAFQVNPELARDVWKIAHGHL